MTVSPLAITPRDITNPAQVVHQPMEQVQGVLHLVQQTNNNSDDVSSKACLKEDDLPSPTSGLLGNDSLVNNLHLIRGGEVYLGLKNWKDVR